LVGDATAPAAARKLVHGLRREMDAASLQRAQVVLSELVTAAVREDVLDADGAVCVQGTVSGSVARFEVWQVSPGFEPDADQSERPDWGFLALNELSDAWGVVRSDDNTPDRLWFEFYLEPSHQPAVA
jgi:hypothetical protein